VWVYLEVGHGQEREECEGDEVEQGRLGSLEHLAGHSRCQQPYKKHRLIQQSWIVCLINMRA